MAIVNLQGRATVREVVMQPGTLVWIRCKQHSRDGDYLVQPGVLKNTGDHHAIVQVLTRRNRLRCLVVHASRVFPRVPGEGI